MGTVAIQTLRGQAREAVQENVQARERFAHLGNYHRLHVRRDGTVGWTEQISRDEDTIDNQAEHFAAIRSVALVGTGSYSCECDYCGDVYHADDERAALERGEAYDRAGKFATRDEAISAYIEGADLTDIEEDMLRQFDEIEIGYFDDEQWEKLAGDPNPGEYREHEALAWWRRGEEWIEKQRVGGQVGYYRWKTGFADSGQSYASFDEAAEA